MPSPDLLTRILSQPTAPFREFHVQAVLEKDLKEAKVPSFRDRAGNIVVGAASAVDYKKKLRARSKNPLLVFIAHTDHPGFHGAEWLSGTDLRFDWFGGSPTALHVGAKVWLADENGHLGHGEVASAQMHESGKFLAGGVVRCEPGLVGRARSAKKIFGGFGFRAPIWEEGDLIYTHAADDLVGCYAIVSTAIELWSSPRLKARRQDFIGLLTRGEEVGFIGALAHLELGFLSKAKRRIVAVSLETSRTLPGAEIGKGPVVRLGDRFTTFDPSATRVFAELAQKVLPGTHQRRIMDGGTCEATAVTAYGLPAIGISVPLGNYHNQGLELGPDSRGPNGPSPEFVHLQDVAGLLTLCRSLIETNLPWNDPWATKRTEMKKNLAQYRSHLA